MTLDDDTFRSLQRHAGEEHSRLATFAGRLLRDALERREARERARALAADYRAGAADVRGGLDDLELAQLDLMGAEDE